MDQGKSEKLKDDHVLNVLLCAIAIPLSMSMWIVNIFYSKFIVKNDGFDGKLIILYKTTKVQNYFAESDFGDFRFEKF